MHALIDSDSACYAVAFTSVGMSEAFARQSLNSMIEDTLLDLNTQDFTLFITGEDNFRYSIYPEYKANRNQPKPEHLQMLKEHLRDAWKANVSVGCEADDAIGVEHYARNCESIVVSIDKDLNQFVGTHWNPRKKERYIISPRDSMLFFYTQLLTGDVTDNIKGVKGIGPKKAERLLAQCETEQEMFEACRDAYGCDQELVMNAKCLWLWRKENDIWKWPEWAEPMEEISGMDTSS
jgi:5'-3' exonuclease